MSETWMARLWRAKDMLLVLQSGIISSAVVLVILWFLEGHWLKSHVMGWSFYHIIPVGALAAGGVAILGYGIAAIWTDFPVRKWFVGLVILLQLGVYVGGEYVRFRQLDLVYRSTDEPIGFWTYFDLTSRSFHTIKRIHRANDIEGPGGWGWRILEMGGFAAAAVVLPAFRKTPGNKCAKCGVAGQLRSKDLGTWRFTPQVSWEQWLSSQEEGGDGSEDLEPPSDAYYVAQAEEFVRPLKEAIARADAAGVLAAMEELDDRSERETAPHCLVPVWVLHCKTCGEGDLVLKVRWKSGTSLRSDLLEEMALVPQMVTTLLRGEVAAEA